MEAVRPVCKQLHHLMSLLTHLLVVLKSNYRVYPATKRKKKENGKANKLKFAITKGHQAIFTTMNNYCTLGRTYALAGGTWTPPQF